MRAIPQRSSRILGIDANGHVGRDGSGGIGCSGQEKWTNNGHELEKMTNNCRLVALNTITSCRAPGWTWQKRDGIGRGRIDYLLIDHKAQNLIRENNGAMDLPTWGTQGSAIDHRPVQASIIVQTLQEKGWTSEVKGTRQAEGYTGKNQTLIKAYETHIKICENKVRVKQEEIGKEEWDNLIQIQEMIRVKIEEKWSPHQSANEMQQTIDCAMKETYDEICREKKKQLKKREFICEDTLESIREKNQYWGEVRKWWKNRKFKDGSNK